MKTTELATKLKELRTLKGMSQEFLADESRVSLRTIQRIENRESTPTGETVKRIAVALDVDMTELLGPHATAEAQDLGTTIIYLKKRLSKSQQKSEIKSLENFIKLLQQLKEKDLSPEKLEGIESYLRYLELEKIPSFSHKIFKSKLHKFKKYLKVNLHFVPTHYYSVWAAAFGLPFAIGFGVQNNVGYTLKLSVIATVLILLAIGVILDKRMQRQQRALHF